MTQATLGALAPGPVGAQGVVGAGHQTRNTGGSHASCGSKVAPVKGGRRHQL